jgi:tripartite-type tricarboxylate transporter receptor subunit TctC
LPKDIDADARAKLEDALAMAVKSDAFVDFVNNKFRGFEIFLDGDAIAASIAEDAEAYRGLLAVPAE